MPRPSFEEMQRRDLELVRKLANKPVKALATEYKLPEASIRQWIYRIRERRRKYQRYLNLLNNEMKRSSRVRKMLLSSKLEVEEEEIW